VGFQTPPPLFEVGDGLMPLLESLMVHLGHIQILATTVITQ